MNSNVLVTGSLGYIGSALIPELIKQGFEVIGYDTGFFENSLLYESKTCSLIRGDMRNMNFDILDGIDAVVHLASIANDPFGNLDVRKIYDPITEYSFILAKECKKRGIRLIWPSSCSVYGIASGFSDENSKPNPQTPYSRNKVDFEEVLSSLSDADFRPIVLRLCTLYGLSSRIRFDLVVNMFAGMAFTGNKIVLNSDGKSWRPLVHMNDVIDSIICSIRDEPCLEEHEMETPIILNVGDNKENYQIFELANIVAELNGNTQVNYVHSNQASFSKEQVEDQNVKDGIDARTYRVNFNKIRRVFPKFRPSWNIEKGVSSMFKKFREIDLDIKTFQSNRFYRLRMMEELHENNRIDDELVWVES